MGILSTAKWRMFGGNPRPVLAGSFTRRGRSGRRNKDLTFKCREASCSLHGGRQSFYVHTVILNLIKDCFSGWDPHCRQRLDEGPKLRMYYFKLCGATLIDFQGSTTSQATNKIHFTSLTKLLVTPISSHFLVFIPYSSVIVIFSAFHVQR